MREARLEQAQAAAVEALATSGITVSGPRVLKDSNNTVIAFDSDDRIVAKVATSVLPGRDGAVDREVRVLQHLRSSNAPTSRLAELVPGIIHEALNCRMIFLDRFEEIDEPTPVAEALVAVHTTHDGLASFDRSGLPSFLDAIRDSRGIVATQSLSPTLPVPERRFCIDVAAKLDERLRDHAWHDIVLHGDPWIGGNLVQTVHGPKLIDFEAVCMGPREWDLSAMGDVADQASETNAELLETCRSLRSFMVAAWCWTQPERAPEVADAAAWHLTVLHSKFD